MLYFADLVGPEDRGGEAERSIRIFARMPWIAGCSWTGSLGIRQQVIGNIGKGPRRDQ